MAKLLYHVTMSLDGFVAAPGDDMSWLGGLHTGPNPAVERVLGEVGAVLMGHRTYAPATTAEGEVYGGRWAGPIFVVTRDAAPMPGFTLLAGLPEAAAAAAEAAGSGYVAVLGARTARRCLEAGLLDEVLVHVAPVLLGDGVRLFDHPGGTRARLDPVELSHAGPIANVRYRVR
ncbi:dihydrofolate reductase family protein [Amycolatopsis vancoresmycina]|uniref:Bifunctional deaminase-reductase domain-containing protein n=1 Tax=Amycolatopsis vancoresmycina DSM 44592 TaxID=1292037 RepID=R1GFW9_9PSEU|nr:dihydrofolate reductase family protein [Amycolatopsis vancoresmycina]EOD70182.1 bifunctional deaminase-reductase domain-containing protein [Amycolatopsis vancoresmycina DSM 44592]